MKIWLYCIFSNEAELLPFFLRHYAPQVDRLIMFDNGSTDNSRALIHAYKNGEVFKYPSNQAVMDSVGMTYFASHKYREARGQADWVLWVDCDEFLWSGPIALRELLRGYQQQGIRAVQSVGYQMLSNEFPTSDAPLTDQIRYGIADREYDKVSAFDPALDVTWRPGRHVCNIDGNVTAYRGELRLLHYRFIGLDFWQRRNAYNYAHRSEAEIASNRSYHAAPEHTGKYSLAWYQNAMAYMSDVVTQEWIGV